MSRVEHALGMMRVYLVERITQTEWNEDSAAELAQIIMACLRQQSEGPHQKAPGHDPKLVREELRRAVRFVNDNLDTKLKWDDIAAAVGLDSFSFGRGFKLATGMTPHQYIIRCRLRRAMRLLAQEDRSLADIAFEVGCSCQSHLTTLFRKHLGTTPGAYRGAARERRRREMSTVPAVVLGRASMLAPAPRRASNRSAAAPATRRILQDATLATA